MAYQNHLSLLKYGSEYLTTARMGAFNMGRNFSIKVVVPISIKKRIKQIELGAFFAYLGSSWK
jgi:hypothetical protein